MWYAKWIRRTKFAEPFLPRLRKYDARCCIILTEGYRSGHNEAVLKTVWAHAHVGSNPTPSAKTRGDTQEVSPRVLIDGSALRNLVRATRARGKFAFLLAK